MHRRARCLYCAALEESTSTTGATQDRRALSESFAWADLTWPKALMVGRVTTAESQRFHMFPWCAEIWVSNPVNCHR